MSHIRSVKNALSFSEFRLRLASIHLYRRILRISNTISDREERQDIRQYVRHEFNVFRDITDEEHIKQLQRDGRQQADRLEKMIMIAK